MSEDKEILRDVLNLTGYGEIFLDYEEEGTKLELSLDNGDFDVVTVELSKREIFCLIGKLMEAQGWLE